MRLVYKEYHKKVCRAQKFLYQTKQTNFFKTLQNDGSPKLMSRGGLQNRCVSLVGLIPQPSQITDMRSIRKKNKSLSSAEVLTLN